MSYNKMKLTLFVIVLCFLGAYLKAEEIPKSNYILIEKSDLYKIYCVHGYKWIKWDIMNTNPIQMFEYHNGQSAPVICKNEE